LGFGGRYAEGSVASLPRFAQLVLFSCAVAFVEREQALFSKGLELTEEFPVEAKVEKFPVAAVLVVHLRQCVFV